MDIAETHDAMEELLQKAIEEKGITNFTEVHSYSKNV